VAAVGDRRLCRETVGQSNRSDVLPVQRRPTLSSNLHGPRPIGAQMEYSPGPALGIGYGQTGQVAGLPSLATQDAKRDHSLQNRVRSSEGSQRSSHFGFFLSKASTVAS
jgi:hypothetical protein